MNSTIKFVDACSVHSAPMDAVVSSMLTSYIMQSLIALDALTHPEKEMSSLKPLDDGSCSLRLLMELTDLQDISTTGLYERMRVKHGVGRTAVDSSREALLAAGFIQEIKAKTGDGKHNVKIMALTRLGYDVILELQKIIAIIESHEKKKTVNKTSP